MKILFLQYWYDFYGGIETVNDTLANQFVKDGFDVSILCLWKTGKGEYVYSNNYSKILINNEPQRESYKKIINEIFKFKLSKSFYDIKKNLKFYSSRKKDYKDFSNKINTINPDFIIVSNPALIEFVPKKYLSKTVIHLHSGFQFYLEQKKLTKKILKYNNKIKSFIWLSPNTVKQAKEIGFTNSTYMFDPVRIKSDVDNKLLNKKIVFIGRLAPEKRVGLLTEIFNKSNLSADGWQLDIYGDGDKSNINLYDGVCMQGATNDVKKVLLNSSVLALTSEYEGFSMVVLEAYACGVPVIVFNYGAVCPEVVYNNVTGYIIEQNNAAEYTEKLKELCTNYNLRKKMGENAKKMVEKFYPEKIAQRWYKLFRGEL